MALAHDYKTNGTEQRNQKDPIDAQVGAAVKNRRMVCGITQTELANKLGITFQQVQKYEKGANRMGASRLWNTACILDCRVESFFEGVEEIDVAPIDPGRNRLADYRNSAQGLGLCLAMSRITDENTRKRIVSLAHGIADSSSSED